MVARRAFLFFLAAALPGLLWQGFEMYGLTLRGSQMLFFAIAHTMPLAVLLVVLAVPFMLVVFVQAVVALGRPGYRARVGISRRALMALVVYVPFHGLMLGTYEIWSGTSLRIPMCLLGVGLLSTAFVFVSSGLRRRVGAEADAV